MKFLVDAQLPPALAKWIESKGHQARRVHDLGLRDADDDLIWIRAASESEIIVTKDEDFALLAARNTAGPVVLWVRTGNLVNRLLLARFERGWAEVETHLLSGTKIVELH